MEAKRYPAFEQVRAAKENDWRREVRIEPPDQTGAACFRTETIMVTAPLRTDVSIIIL